MSKRSAPTPLKDKRPPKKIKMDELLAAVHDDNLFAVQNLISPHHTTVKNKIDAFYKACNLGRIRIADYLLPQFAELKNFRNFELDLAFAKGDLNRVIELFNDEDTILTQEKLGELLNFAATKGFFLLVDYLTDFDITKVDQFKALLRGVTHGHLLVTKMLFKQLQSEFPPKYCNHLLREASKSGQALIVEFLLKKIPSLEINQSLSEEEIEVAMKLAQQNGHYEVVSTLRRLTEPQYQFTLEDMTDPFLINFTLSLEEEEERKQKQKQEFSPPVFDDRTASEPDPLDGDDELSQWMNIF
ncbi:MAG: hypothetical protein ACHQJ6_08685 [Candidatus Berkiellales bacterium]